VIVVDPIDGTTASFAAISDGRVHRLDRTGLSGRWRRSCAGSWQNLRRAKRGGPFLTARPSAYRPEKELAGARIVSPRDKTEFFEKSA